MSSKFIYTSKLKVTYNLLFSYKSIKIHFTKSLQFYYLLNLFSNQTDKNICWLFFIIPRFLPGKITWLAKQHFWQQNFTTAARVRHVVNTYNWTFHFCFVEFLEAMGQDFFWVKDCEK